MKPLVQVSSNVMTVRTMMHAHLDRLLSLKALFEAAPHLRSVPGTNVPCQAAVQAAAVNDLAASSSSISRRPPRLGPGAGSCR